MATIFVSPGVYTKEQDFTVFASRIGITRLGLAGLTQRGPAFEAVKVSSTDEFLLRFGSTDPNLPLPYVANSFLGQSKELTIVRALGKNGYTNSGAWIISADDNSSLSGATLAVIRSKKNQISGNFYFDASTDIEIGNITGPLNTFTLSGSTGPLTAETLSVSLDETREDYILNILGKSPKVVSGLQDIYVEKIYPHALREAVARGEISNLRASISYSNSSSFTDYSDSYTNAVTPWIVSRVIGGVAKDLFKIHTISDGDAANTEIKFSIANIDVVTKTFDIIVRSYNDTDATVGSTAIERWSNMTLDNTKPNFIGKVIGTLDETYPSKSRFITIELAESLPVGTLPAGFKGYELRDPTGLTGVTVPPTYYKTTYLSGDSRFKTYLGLSELGYTSITQDQVSVGNSVKTLENDIFGYIGGVTSAGTVSTTKGFHLENTADSSLYESGDKNSLTAYTNVAGTLIDKGLLKFTVAPAGGFDGWDALRQYSNHYERFTDAFEDNKNVLKEAIDIYLNPEEVDINLFAIPGVDYSNNTNIVKYALSTIEDRADTLYVVDAPRITTSSTNKGTPEEAVSILQGTGIDSSYAATYWPWVQLEDPNTGKYTFQAPTFMVLKAIAFTDNVAQPWFAPAGINRGTASSSVIQTDVKLNKSNRDTLYDAGINPVVSQVQQGIFLGGQKTLQVRDSALDRINVRRLLLQVRRLISAASLTLLFEQNDQTLRDQFLAKVEPLLLQIQNQRGLSGFKVVMDESNNTAETIDRNTLVGKIQLKPTRVAEFIDLTFQVLPTGANFEDF